MARTKEFDPEAALQSALQLFWQRGYEATSMADLVEHLGIGRASIYATFGNKHELYLKALDRYSENRDSNLLHELSQPGAALPAVRTAVRRFAAEAKPDAQSAQWGFNTTTAPENGPPHPPAGPRGVGRSGARDKRVHSALTRAQAQGELPAERDPRALARMLLVLMQGLRIVGKASKGPGRVRDAAEQALSLLD
ncbi:TetR/AcrR family transcriptional regulator [Streptomyces anulatus]|uniref:TetR/AcrR family transcriptional regulator n=1 Tax=Streptomyces anulatus TaxID=1892 RepID=UPI003653168C